MTGIVLLVVFACSIPMCFARPFYGVLLWMVVAFLNPQAYVSGFAASFPVALAVAIPTIAGMAFFERGWMQQLASPEAFLLAVLWLWFTVTTLVSVTTPAFMHHAADTWTKWEIVSKILLMTFVTIGVLRSIDRLRMLMLVIAGCFGIFVLKALPFMIVTGGQFRIYGPDNSMIADNNDFGLALVMTVPVFFFLAQSETARWLRRLMGFLCLIAIPTILFTYSRGALLGLAAVLALMILRSKQRLLLIPVMVFGSIIAIAFAPAAWQARMSGNIVDASALSRFNAWSFSWRLALDYPLTGGGFATFTRELFDRYAPNVLDVHNSHSVYFGVLAEHGFIGLILYVALLVSCFFSTTRVISLARIHEDQTAIHYANMLRFSIVGFLVSGAFLSRSYFDYFFTMVAATAVLRRVCAVNWAETEESALHCDEVFA